MECRLVEDDIVDVHDLMARYSRSEVFPSASANKKIHSCALEGWTLLKHCRSFRLKYPHVVKRYQREQAAKYREMVAHIATAPPKKKRC